MKKNNKLLEILKQAFYERLLTKEELEQQKKLVAEIQTLISLLPDESKEIVLKIESILNQLNTIEFNSAIEFVYKCLNKENT